MAHAEEFFFVDGVKKFLPDYFQGKKVLEIGSLNINGSVRSFFEHCEYIGIDVGNGQDVDVVCHGEHYGGSANDFDVIISCEAMEHNPGWRETWINMLRMVKPDGLVIMTCASEGRRQHGTPEMIPSDSPLTIELGQSYYRNLVAEDFTNLLNLDVWFSVWGFFRDCSSQDLYFFGIARDASEVIKQAALNLRGAFLHYYQQKNIEGRY